MPLRGIASAYLCLLIVWLDLARGKNANETFKTRAVSVSASAYGYRRSVRLPTRGGTINWELLSPGPAMFNPRHSHATCVFRCPHDYDKQCIWLAGGRSKDHVAFNLVKTTQNDDVWWSEDGALWNRVMILDGDFLPGAGNADAKPKGQAAPWYGRYGHSLDAIDGDGDGVADVMVLTGGFSPVESNDVWISRDGANWYFDGYAPFPPRAYHATAFFRNKLWILGGTPLTNDVWAGTLKEDTTKAAGHTMVWRKKLAHMKTPWFPRAGLCAVTQLRPTPYANKKAEINDQGGNFTEYLYVIGGFGGYPRNDIRHNGERARNDVWLTTNGVD